MTLLHTSAVALLLLVSTLFTLSSATYVCTTQDSPNPIAQQYPLKVSGTLNGTTLIVPISLISARQIIPKNYTILVNSYRSLLPSFPDGMYPMMVSALHDHDIHFPALNLTTPSFSRASLEFPFLDILGDHYSTFRWAGTIMITNTNLIAIRGSMNYGIKVYPTAFDPPCDAYRTLENGTARFWAHSSNGTVSENKYMLVETQKCPYAPYPMDFIRNITNQPVFANTMSCDNYIRLYNTSLTSSPHEPVSVKGTVTANLEPFTTPQTWKNVYGWQFATAFLEPPLPLTCESLKGFQDS
ncbi:uncharacterized protein BCR38DRAFT_330460 [Pseudomassariella vexata]|uniref:Uncharacterized protein n=1 Tax=Pseudomassariella vexata TaxID=1141098 RepID=A0A1Y2EKL3_9PEZI|nr:uncharacterized protein BCR38DRAFT_330460 [Pseudomassariella vexata]ORY72078.1 hypothetical protein BCR38DRAFT_330460 [Pseudomassariella vexata]